MDLNQLHHVFAAVAQTVAEHAPAVAESLAESAPAAAEAAHETAAEADQGVLGLLGINWKLFVAQLVNFGIILFIFWKWIVKPLGSALTARQEKIESGLKHAEEMEVERKNFEQWKTDEMKKARQDAEAIITKASSTAEQLKQQTMTTANEQAGKLLEQTKATLEMEKQQMLKEVRQEVADLVVTASEKLLKEKLTDRKDRELIRENLEGVK